MKTVKGARETGPLYIDFETASVADLKKVGLHNYAHDPSTRVLCMAYAFGDGPVSLVDSATHLDAIRSRVASGGTVVAHNAAFEICIWNTTFAPQHGLPYLKPENVICTMAACYAMALPGALENAAKALGLRLTKDMDGRALMLKMCKPMNLKRMNDGVDAEPKWVHEQKQITFKGEKMSGAEALRRLGEYCKTDVDVERAIYKRVMPLSRYERRVWAMDWRINNRGIQLDMPMLDAALKAKDEIVARLDKRMEQVTDGHVAACTNIGALKEWAADHGVIQESLAKAEIGELLDEDALPEVVRTALELRREAGRATSVAKLEAARRLAGRDGRVRNILQYHGAATGRWAGRGLQPHNFPRDLPKPEVVEDMRRLLLEGDIDTIDILYDAPLSVISKLLRAFIIAPNGTLIGGDYSNVEGRGIAWLAGEEWKLKAFRDSDADPEGPDIYERSYAVSFGMRAEDVDKHQRQVGKVIELSMGYQGGVGAFQSMARVYGVVMADERADEIKVAWRGAHPRIKQYWYDLQRAALSAVEKRGKIFCAGAPGRQVKFRVAGSFLWALLPSGRALCYPYPEIRKNEYGPYLTYKTVPSQDDFKLNRLEDDKSNTRQWARVSTYGGKLAENVTQALCRDLLVDAMLRLEDAGYPVVLHVHDEAIEEGKFGEKDRAKIERIMSTPPSWAREFPLAAGVWMSPRYVKE